MNTRKLELNLREINHETMTVPCTVSSEYPVRRNNEYEILSHDPSDIDLSRANPLPLVLDHSLGLPCGVVEQLTVSDKSLKGILRVGTAHKDVWRNISEKIYTNLSVCYDLLKRIKKTDTGSIYSWQPTHAAVVQQGADPTAGINRSLTTKKGASKEMTREKIIEERKQAVEEMASMALKDTFTPDEQIKYDGLKTQVNTCNRRLEVLTLQEGIEEKRSTHVPELYDGGGSDRPQNRNGPCEDKSFRGMFHGGDSDVKLDDGGFESFEEFINVVASGRHDPRLTRTMVESSGPSGGYATPEAFSSRILDQSLLSEVIRPRASVFSMTTKTKKIPYWQDSDISDHTSLFGGFGIRWQAETSTATNQSGAIGIMQLNAHLASIYADMSLELKEDSLNMESQLIDKIKQSLSYGLDKAFLTQTGAGVPQGILESNCVISVAKETDQTSNTLNRENLVKMYARQLYKRTATFFASPDTIPNLMSLSLTVGSGGSFFPIMSDASGSFKIFGRPVVFTEHLATVGGTSTLTDIAFLNVPSYMIGMRKDLSLDKSLAPGWFTRTESYRCQIRCDGQSSILSEISMPNSLNSLSPFVTLAQRA